MAKAKTEEPTTNEFTVDSEQLQSYLDSLSDDSKAIGEATGTLRANLKAILETEGYHKAAMAMVRKIDAMSETQQADFLRTFKPMFDAMFDAYWSSAQVDLLDE